MSTTRAIFVPKSKNVKIRSARNRGEVSTTYASVTTSCPATCELRNNGCYAQNGPVGFTTRRLDRGATRPAPILTAKQEAQAIDASFGGGEVPQDGVRGGRDLRLHTSGDASTAAAASILGAAAARWKARKGGRVWTYTHAGKTVPRAAWGPAVSVLASVDSLAEVPAVQANGYAVARYVATFPSEALGKAWLEAGIRWVPCPAQTCDDIGCADCYLCSDADGLRRRNTGIVFVAHGSQANKVKRRLTVVAA